MTATRHVFLAGGGGIGRALALMLLDEESFPCRVTIGDVDAAAARDAAHFAAHADGEATPLTMPAEGSSPELAAALSAADAVIDCLPGSQAPRIARLAREHGCHYLNLTEYVRETEEVLAIAQGADTCFALQCGLAPGVIDVLGTYLLERAASEWGCERYEHLRLRVGALPRFVRAPHFYGWTWSPVGVATEYVRPSIAVRDHQVVRLPSLSERALVTVDGMLLEEDLTSGGAADLPEALKASVRQLDYKTLRYPGHYAWVDGLLDELPDDDRRAARLERTMLERIPACEDDVVVVLAEVEAFDRAGRLRARKAARIVHGIEVAGQHLRAIQSTTAAGVAEVLRLVLERGLRGPLLQSQIPPGDLLRGAFVRRAYGELV